MKPMGTVEAKVHLGHGPEAVEQMSDHTNPADIHALVSTEIWGHWVTPKAAVARP